MIICLIKIIVYYYNLSAVGASIKVEDLKTGYIVHMNIDNMGHWAVIEYLSDNVVLNNAI